MLSRQLADYPRVHHRRRNLLLHAISNPLFLLGNLAIIVGPLIGAWSAMWLGLAMPVAIAIQGAGHKAEPERPLPFSSPGELVQRLFVEQWITFPRFVIGGGFARAWRAQS